MGVYPEYGLEYLVRCLSGSWYTVASIQQTNGRLLKSSYYQNRYDYYQNNQFSEWMTELQPYETDVVLTQSEKSYLNSILNGRYGAVEKHGWYDVGRVVSSY